MTGIENGFRRIWRFMVDDVWDLDLRSLSAPTSFGVRVLRIAHLVPRGFVEDECRLHSSALTFTTLMSIVPVLALSLALARGLGDAETAKNRIRNLVADWTNSFESSAELVEPGRATALDETSSGDGMEAESAQEVFRGSDLAAEINRLVDQAFEKVENISFAALGGVGLVFLVWMVISVLGQIEASFNKVWGVTSGRSIWRRFTDYISIVLVFPVLVAAASSVPIVEYLTRFMGEPSARHFQAIIESGPLKALTVVVMTTLCFTFVIMFMPNTRVKTGPGLLGGLVTAVLFLGWLKLCASLQFGVARYGAIYGSFAVLPILLAWVFVSWSVVLFGAEVAFAVQNCDTYRMEQGASSASVEAKLVMALAIAEEMAKAMSEKDVVFDAAAFAGKKGIPIRFANDVLSIMSRSGLVVEVSGMPGRFVLARTPESLQVREVAAAVLESGVKPAGLGLKELDNRIIQAVRETGGKIEASMGAATIGALTSRA